MLTSHQTIHFVGIGGSGMSGIAEVLLNLGYKVTGSDIKKSHVTDRLERLGALIQFKHDKNNVTNVDIVVVSSAVNNQNPEIEAARAANKPVVHRSEMLAELMVLKNGIAVAGTHGKTTTTSLLASALISAGLDPTCIIGGHLNSVGSNAQVGKGEFFIAEADESDGSFLRLKPTIAVVTNIDLDHMDHYSNIEEISNAFYCFLETVPLLGVICACIDDPGVKNVLPLLRKKIVSYGLDNTADITALNLKAEAFSMRFTPRVFGKLLPEVVLKMPGRYNVSNALASYAVAHFLDLDMQKISDAINAFEGVLHRFTILGEVDGVTVVDDYAHNPKKISAVLGGVRGAHPNKLVCAVFQPHRYSRLSALWNDFAQSFVDADVVIVTPVYAASELPIPGIDSIEIAKAIEEHSKKVGASTRVEVVANLKDAAHAAAETIQKMKTKGAVVITLGAGDIQSVGKEVLERLK